MLVVNHIAMWLALVWQLLPQVAGKLQTGSTRLGGPQEKQRWRYAGKFGYAIGKGGRYEVRVRLRQPLAANQSAQVDLSVYLDEDWGRVEALAPCSRARDGQNGPSRRMIQLTMPQDTGVWGPWKGGRLSQNVRPHIWYFALSSGCRGGDELSANNEVDIDFEIHMHQFDGSELSVEQRHMPIVSTFGLFGFTAFLTRLCMRCRHVQRSTGELHPVIHALGGATTLQWAALAFHAVHLWAYVKNGFGIDALDLLAEILFMMSQVVVATLLIAIAQGYTLKHSKTDELTFFKPIVAMVTVLHVVLVGFGKLQGEASEKYHENEGAVGWVLLAVRLLLLAWFTVGVQSSREKGGLRLKFFLNRFQFVGSLYLLAYPAIFTVVQLFAPYLQHPIMQLGLFAMQSASAFWLAHLFLSRSMYFEMSELSASLLPGSDACTFQLSQMQKDD